MSIISPQESNKDEKTVHYHTIPTKNLLMVFTRNPVLGKCKTRLAATVGDKAALDIYKFLLQHTFTITNNLKTYKQVYFSEEIWEDDIWDNGIFDKKLQQGNDLGERMANAFLQGFKDGFDSIIVIGSDVYDITTADLEQAFSALQQNNIVIGPAEDGGYYLLGMNRFHDTLFKNKNWGKNDVFQKTMEDLKNEKVYQLKTKNDIDVYDDIKNIEVFKPFLKKI